jgi:hypothetical protein
MTGEKLIRIVFNQIANDKKRAALVLDPDDSLCPETKHILFDTFNVWTVAHNQDSYFRLAGCHLHTIYVDDAVNLEADVIRYLLTRVRPLVGTGITILRSDTHECTCKKSPRNNRIK